MTTTTASAGTEGAVDELLISADSHVMEPGDLWATRLPKGLRDQAPTFEGVSDQSKPGGWDPTERLKEMAVDGVSLEVLYATRGMTLFRIEDVPLQEACVRAFNDWLIEYCAASPDRLCSGSGSYRCTTSNTPSQSWSAAGTRACAGRWSGRTRPRTCRSPPTGTTRSGPPRRTCRMPVSLHILTGHGYMQRRRGGTEHYRASVNLKIAEVMNSLFDIIFYKALDRFPNLKIVLVENEIGWIPFALQQWGYYLGRHRHHEPGPAPGQDAERIPRRSDLRDVLQRRHRHALPVQLGRRRVHVVQRLPARELHLAELAQGDR